jgi:hypothetical protein
MEEEDMTSGGEPDGRRDDELSTESILEALLVDDAEISWDPVTGKPFVVHRLVPPGKIRLDSSADSP